MPSCMSASTLLLSSLELSDTQVYEPEMRALLRTASHFCDMSAINSEFSRYNDVFLTGISPIFMCVVSCEAHSLDPNPSYVPIDLGTSYLLAGLGLKHKKKVHLRLNVFHDAINFTSAEQEIHCFLSQKKFYCYFETSHSRLLSRWAAL